MPPDKEAHPPGEELDSATRLIHLAMILFGVAALASGDFAGDYKRASHAGFTFHAWAGIGMGAALLLRLAWGFAGPRELRFSRWLPCTSRRLGYVVEDLRSLLRFSLPRRPAHQGLAGFVQAFGLLAFSWMAGTGAVLFFALEPGVRASGWLRLLKDLHEGGQAAVFAYLALHVGAVVLHAVAGEQGWRRMFFLHPR
jgi:cytochrome b